MGAVEFRKFRHHRVMHGWQCQQGRAPVGDAWERIGRVEWLNLVQQSQAHEQRGKAGVNQGKGLAVEQRPVAELGLKPAELFQQAGPRGSERFFGGGHGDPVKAALQL